MLEEELHLSPAACRIECLAIRVSLEASALEVQATIANPKPQNPKPQTIGVSEFRVRLAFETARPGKSCALNKMEENAASSASPRARAPNAGCCHHDVANDVGCRDNACEYYYHQGTIRHFSASSLAIGICLHITRTVVLDLMWFLASMVVTTSRTARFLLVLILVSSQVLYEVMMMRLACKVFSLCFS